jgi:hypothetical protein
MGEMYRARDSRLNRDVAVKIRRLDSGQLLGHGFQNHVCSFIIRSVSRAGISWLVSTSPASYRPAWAGQLSC